jgi:benzoyl-CoA reductase/2-hydroxyglutaryl-CoA dehydratase subunit BcrC/BadD/HgdB
VRKSYIYKEGYPVQALEELASHVKGRAKEIKSLKQKGTKIVAYVPTGYVPEELIAASGAVPVGLIRGGDHDPTITSEAYLIRYVDTFCRSQIGYRVLGEELLYQLPDLLAAAVTDRNMTAIADMWQQYTKVPVFRFGVPSRAQAPHAFQYYLDGLKLLRQRLEDFSGAKISDNRLLEEIDVSNRIRSFLQEISYTRKSDSPPIRGKDFIKLNHASYYADRNTLVKQLGAIAQEVKAKRAPKHLGPRILFTGSTIAEGDYRIPDLLEEAGAAIVIEEFSEGVRHYTQKVMPDGDLMSSLAKRYLQDRTPPAFFKQCMKERFDTLLKLIRDFRVDGVVWYSLMYRDSYDREGIIFPEVLEKEVGIPYLKLTSDYDTTETGALRTRIETFIEMINERRGNVR